MGGSGSGKTTLIRLFAGLYEPTGGELLFDDLPWTQHSDHLMRSSIAYVPQQVFVFNANIRDNITLWQTDYSQDDLEAAASDAQILNTILSHPKGFLRHLRDNGADLSGGERQRLEICRALVRQPSILLLDEATSALDNATQSMVLDALKRRGITVISVAHRLDVALRSDQVLMMEAGQIKQLGPPQALLAAGGPFADLVRSEQASAQEVLA